MAVKTFSTGEVLTASDTNTYLNNGGLVYITSTTFSASVPLVTMTGCFSSTFTNYRLIMNGMSAAAAASIVLRLGASTTGYYGSMFYDSYTGGGNGYARSNNGGFLYAALSDTAASTFASIDIYQPYLAVRTGFSGTYYGRGYTGYMGGSHEVSTSYADLVVLNETGNVTAGTITIMGYRKP